HQEKKHRECGSHEKSSFIQLIGCYGLHRFALEYVHVGADGDVLPQRLEHVVGQANAAVGGVPADGVGVVGAVDQDAVAEAERVLFGVTIVERSPRLGALDTTSD